MTTITMQEKARRFRELHRGGRILVLPNAWDAASARIFARAGFPAIGTTSAGVAWTLGYPDKQQTPRALMLEATRRIVAAADDVPVTADVERGFGSDLDEIRDTVRGVLAAGAVGVNLEDGIDERSGELTPAEVHAARIGAAREVAAAAGVPLFVNARTDVFFLPSGDPAARVAEVLRRAAVYVAAGADGLFVPGIVQKDAIAAVVRGVSCPVNVYAFAGVPPAGELAALGVARVSVGCGPMQATLGLVRRIAEELRTRGTYESLGEGALGVRELNEMMADAVDPLRGR